MPRRPSGRRFSKHQPLAFSPFMRSLALASSKSSSKLHHHHHQEDSQQCSEYISFDAKLPNLSKRGEKEQSLDSSDEEEDSQGDVLADFEFFDPKPTDFNGVKTLLKNYLDDREWGLSSFVDLILEQKTVGTVVKVADDEDESVFAVVTALNFARYKDNKCFREVIEFLLKVCSEKNVANSELELLLEKNAHDVGLLVSQRVINLPPQLLPPLYDGLFDEISWATEDEPTEELRSSFRFKSYLLVTKIYRLKNPKQRKLRRGEEEDDDETIFLKPEDELFLELLVFTFPMRSRLVTSQEMKKYQLMGLVMAVEAKRIPEFRHMLKSLID